MQRTFNLGEKYKVLINQNKKVIVQTGDDEIIVYLGNSFYVPFEMDVLTNFLVTKLSIEKSNEIKSYILNNI